MSLRYFTGFFYAALLLLTLNGVMSPFTEAQSSLWHPSYANDREYLHYGHLRTVKIQSKVNINTASYDDLTGLPASNGHIAITVTNLRPYKSLHDLSKLKDSLPPQQVVLLQRKWLGLVTF
ncbi:MAG: hypothetical protein HEQ32_07135 [Vampirovibrio sp.]